jgi:glycosyltransferase involved in cell wall biosynthesis
MHPNPPRISVIIPCYNEEKYIAQLIENIASQDYPKELTEVIFADGMSTDLTKTIIQNYQEKYPFIQLISNPHRVVPHALNAAIKASTGEIIIRLDAHSIYPNNYFSVLVSKLQEHRADNVGGVWNTQPGNSTLAAKAIVLATSHPLGIGNAGYRLGAQEDKHVDTVPYGCFHRSIFDRIGYFDEQLLRNQDDEFNGRIIKNGGKIVLIPSLEIKYFARENYKKLWRMFYQYGLFKPLVNIKLGAPATLRQFAPPAMVLGLTIPLVLGIFFPFFLALWLCALTLYASMVVAVSVHLAITNGIALYPYLLWCFPVIHFAYGTGYLSGIFKFMLLKQHRHLKPTDIKENR